MAWLPAERESEAAPVVPAEAVMRVVFMGPPGSGKGTQAARLARHLGVPHLSTGDMLRAAKQRQTDLGMEAAQFMDQGHLVPDELIVEVMTERLSEPDCQAGALLDGFPRTVPQAEALDQHLQANGTPLDLVIELRVADEELIRRLSTRASSENRADDLPQTIVRRLQIYQQQASLLQAYYENRGRLAPIDGMAEIDEVFERICQAVEGA